VTELDRIAETNTYGAKKLLTGTNQKYEFYLGAGNSSSDIITYQLDADTRAQTLELSGVGISEKTEARQALQSIDKALTMVSKARAGFGAVQSRFSIASANLDIQRENILEARSRMADTDIAKEVSNLAQAKVMQEAGIAVLAQANLNPDRALRLLR
jgi:flagellin